ESGVTMSVIIIKKRIFGDRGTAIFAAQGLSLCKRDLTLEI
ncbi:MAG: hypothetical protein PWR01_3647, partial [Clostridiales bacterium]|nr:hypothetical protein [Clostridiales bacterium]MDN5282574.1 hypothetical protein [Candidatus Ozemobacter sp.]